MITIYISLGLSSALSFQWTPSILFNCDRDEEKRLATELGTFLLPPFLEVNFDINHISLLTFFNEFKFVRFEKKKYLKLSKRFICPLEV